MQWWCIIRFTTQKSLINVNNVLINTDHMKIHTGKKPHSCTECDKAFCSEKSSNRSYENTHWGEIPSMQPVWQGFWTEKWSYSTYEDPHWRETLPMYPLWQRSAQRIALKNHMTTHTGGKPHQCIECDKAFAQIIKYIFILISIIKPIQKMYI